MKVNSDRSNPPEIPADVDLLAARAFSGRADAPLFRNVELTGVFPATGAVAFRGCFAFDLAITKFDCELFVDSKPMRFGCEILVNPMTNGWAWWPRFGWAPVLCSAVGKIQLQGRPGERWVVTATVAVRPHLTPAEEASKAAGNTVSAPTAYGEVINCTPWVDVVPLEGRL